MSLLVAAVAGCAVPGGAPAPHPAALPRTRAEASNYQETSRYADVRAFLDSLRALRAPLTFGSIGQTTEGREIPYAIASRPVVHSATQAHRLGRPIVYVQANIHAGEVEGKEALLMLLRDLAFDHRRNALDSVIFIAVPIYNADGNEVVGPQEQNRSEQNGPALVGNRTNAAGLNLNRDYVKVEAPETRASLAMFRAWDPDVFVDLHTTDGSFHGYALTYAPPLTPAAALGGYTRDVWLPVLRARMRARHGFETFDYGDFGTDEIPYQDRYIYGPTTDAWTTFDARPRYSTNYYGLRNGVAILSETYSHDPFAQRVQSTYAFVREILSLAAERATELRARRTELAVAPLPDSIAIRAGFTSRPRVDSIRAEIVERTGDTVRTEAGLPPGLRRTGRYVSAAVRLFTSFEPALSAPSADYLLPRRLTAAIDLLATHGVNFHVLALPESSVIVDEFVIDSVRHAPRAFEGHREAKLFGHWRRSTASSRDMIFVRRDQPLGRLAAYLLEPESDDGLVTWNFFEDALGPGSIYPVKRTQLFVPAH